MTDREKLIKELRWWADRCDRTNSGCQVRPLLEWAADKLESGVVVREWIPVTERLPENEGVVLVYGSRGGIYTAEFRRFGDFGGEYPHWHKLNSKTHHCEPTHWMPLPEPPEED